MSSLPEGHRDGVNWILMVQCEGGPDSGGKEGISSEQVRKPDFDLPGKIEPETEKRPNKERDRIGDEATIDEGRILPVEASPAGLRKFSKETSFTFSDELGEQPGIKKLTFGDLVLSVLPWPFHKDLPDVNTESMSESLASELASALDIFFLWNGSYDLDPETSDEGSGYREGMPAKSLTLEDLVSSVLPYPFRKDLPETGESEEGIVINPFAFLHEIGQIVDLLDDFDPSDREQVTHLLGKLEDLEDLIGYVDLPDEVREGFLDLINKLITQLAIWPLGETPAIIHETPEELPGGSFNAGEETDTMTEEQARDLIRDLEGAQENLIGLLSEIQERKKGSGDDDNPDEDGRERNEKE